MKISSLFFALCFIAVSAQAQQADQNNTQKVQMECRELSSTEPVVRPDESLVNGMACRVVKSNPPVAQAAVTNPPAVPAAAPAIADPAQPGIPAKSVPAVTQSSSQQPARDCVILKRMGPADEITSHMYSFGIRGKQFQYVEGQMPDGVKFHGRLTDNDVRKLQSHGARVVIMEPKYNADDLKEAKKSCSES